MINIDEILQRNKDTKKYLMDTMKIIAAYNSCGERATVEFFREREDKLHECRCFDRDGYY